MAGAEIEAIDRLRPLTIACTAAAVKAILEFARNYLETEKGNDDTAKDNGDTEKVITDDTFRISEDECPQILGKITWDGCGTWKASWKDASGKQSTKRFKLESEPFKEMRLQAYEEAVSFWNDNDRSKRDRINVSR